MKKVSVYFLIVVNAFLFFGVKAQVAAPDLRCVSVASPTSAVLTWVVPSDPLGLFTQYQIWCSPTQAGPYSLIGTVNFYLQSSYTQTPSNANLQSQYYYITTVSGTYTSSPSDTLRSVFLNLSNPGNGVINLNWNATKSPLLTSSSTTYTLSRKTTPGSWSPIYTGNHLNFKDTITLCKVFYNYKVEISDGLGCISSSNIASDTCYNVQPPNVLVIDSVSVDDNGQTIIGWPQSSSLDLDCYIIYSSSGGFLTEIGRVCGISNTIFTNTVSNANSGSEGYCIAGIDSCGNFSIPSLTNNTMFLSTTYDLCQRMSTLTWTAYSNLPKGVLKYDIYCSINGAAYAWVGSSNSNTFNHSGLIPGSLYCYYIRVVNSDNSITARSNKACLTAGALPGPSFVYINSVSVNPTSKFVEITYSVDTLQLFKGCHIYKSEDGINFTRLTYISSTVSPQTYIDKNVHTQEKNYFYKVEVADNCDNPGVVSNVSKTILLHVSNDQSDFFNVTLTWDSYSTWLGGVQSYNIYRAVNGIFNPTPIINVPVLTKSYTDNVQDFVSSQGKFSYYIEAVEGTGNVYGFLDKATSNPSDAFIEVSVFVPNAFVPKGLNSVWLPIAQYVEKTDYKVMVFNRWGDKVFETHSDTEGWTGNDATDEVYVYIIEYKNARGEYIQLNGHVNIVR